MDNNFKFITRHVSIVQRSSSVVNSFASSVELIQAIALKPMLKTLIKSGNEQIKSSHSKKKANTQKSVRRLVRRLILQYEGNVIL